jgi:cytidine deaminase
MRTKQPAAPGENERLFAAARAAVERAYAPYSGYRVGAAVRDERGRIFAGANVENASYGLTLCAERAAVGAAVSGGARRIQAVAVAASRPPEPVPCGACRQVLAEFAAPGTPVYVLAPAGAVRRFRLGALLPRGFALRPPPRRRAREDGRP